MYFSVKTKYLESDLQHLLEDLVKALLVVFHVDKDGREKEFPFLCFNKKKQRQNKFTYFFTFLISEKSTY